MAIDPAMGTVDPDFPMVNGSIYAVAPDGAGGWYIGGSFTTVGELGRSRLAHILPDKTVGPWNPYANSTVYALAVSDTVVYAGGYFSSIGGQTRSGLAAIDAATGSATAWDPHAANKWGEVGEVEAIHISGTTVYIGGYFYSVAGQPLRTYFAGITDPSLANRPPAAFDLIVPDNATTIYINEDHLVSALSLAWYAAEDADGDEVRYSLVATGDLAILTIGDTTATKVSFPFAGLVTAIVASGNSTLTGAWTISATDGQEVTPAANGPFDLTIIYTPLLIEEQGGLPREFALHPNYPNPFNPSTTIRFDLPEAAEVRLVVYDLMGREVARLVDGQVAAGYQRVVWNGRDASGKNVPSGMYIARLVTPEYTKSIKLALLK